jgi:hypothetical protein
MKKCISIIVIILGTFNYAFCQDGKDTLSGDSNAALHIFLDCNECDPDYFRTSFTIVNYVNDCKDADVHILVTALPTGSGGTAYTIILSGQGSYKNKADTVLFNLSQDATAEVARAALLAKIQLGLVPYLLKTPYGEKLNLIIDESPVITDEADPWKSWVFDISGSGSFSSQKTSQSLSLGGSLYLSKITPEIKIESGNSFSYNESKLSLYNGDTLVYALNLSQRDYFSRNLFVKSLGNHCGIGGFASFAKSEYSNLDFQMILGPAVEFNLFSYEDASSKQFRILYSINYEHTNYKKMTVYNKMNDHLFRHDLSINFMYYEPWGTISAYAYGSAYINNLSQYSLGTSAVAYIRLFKGLSFNISCGVAYSQDQRSLRQEPVSTEFFLTRQWEMKRDFSYSVMGGLSYRFGSMNNNSVNPRFGD